MTRNQKETFKLRNVFAPILIAGAGAVTLGYGFNSFSNESKEVKPLGYREVPQEVEQNIIPTPFEEVSSQRFKPISKPKAVQPVVQTSEVQTKKTNDKYSFMDVYDPSIDKDLVYFNGLHNRSPGKNLVKAMIYIETGKNPKFRKTAFVFDPMQIANKGDFALRTLADKKELTHLVGNFSCLVGIPNTPRKNGEWDYSNTKMDSEKSIYGGIGWLYQKDLIYGQIEKGEVLSYTIKSGDVLSKVAPKLGTTLDSIVSHTPGVNPGKIKPGQVIQFKASSLGIRGWKDWKEAVRDYNGGGNPNYVQEVYAAKSELDKRN